jgi:hypothetical protein
LKVKQNIGFMNRMPWYSKEPEEENGGDKVCRKLSFSPLSLCLEVKPFSSLLTLKAFY